MAAVEGDKVYTSLLTNTKYLSGLLTLEYSIRNTGSKYPFLVLYTDSLEPEGIEALDRRGIKRQRVDYLLPSAHKDYDADSRFYDCWSKLQPFNLTQYKRVVQLDSDMLVLDSIDDLMTLHLDGDEHVFAASHACVCNPHNKPHYPANFIPSNCAYTFQHSKPEEAQTKGADPLTGLGLCNGGLQVVNPSREDYQKILAKMREPAATDSYDFADQSLLSDVFKGRWLPLPYVYNALKTLRYAHAPIWKDEKVKNIHYILNPKPWDETEEDKKRPDRDPIMATWWLVNDKRKAEEKEAGIVDKW